jgi:hypothetical protein
LLQQSSQLFWKYGRYRQVWLHCKYAIQHYVIKFVSDLWQVGGFLQVLQFPPPIQLTATITFIYINIKLTVSLIFSQELWYVPWITTGASSCDTNGFKSRFSTCNKTKKIIVQRSKLHLQVHLNLKLNLVLIIHGSGGRCGHDHMVQTPCHGKVYSIQHYVIEFVSYLW